MPGSMLDPLSLGEFRGESGGNAVVPVFFASSCSCVGSRCISHLILMHMKRNAKKKKSGPAILCAISKHTCMPWLRYNYISIA